MLFSIPMEPAMSFSERDNPTEHEVEERIFTTSVAEVYPIKIIYIVGLFIIVVLVGWAMFYMGMVNWYRIFLIVGLAFILGYFFWYFLVGVKSVTLSSRGIKISKRLKTLSYSWDQIKLHITVTKLICY